jgi:hypothetical protein
MHDRTIVKERTGKSVREYDGRPRRRNASVRRGHGQHVPGGEQSNAEDENVT